MTETSNSANGDFLSRFPSAYNNQTADEVAILSKRRVPRQRDHFFGSAVTIPTAFNYSEAYGIGALRGRKHVQPVGIFGYILFLFVFQLIGSINYYRFIDQTC